MGVSKVIYGNNTLIDLTGDTVTAEKLMSGETAHGADGNPIVGTATGANLQERKSIHATTSIESIDPDTGYDGFKSVIVYPTPAITGYATPSETGRILYPPSGKYFSSVEVDPIPQAEETTLWTNSSPTSSMSATTLTLSQNLNNFDYIRFEYRFSTSNSASYSVIIAVYDVIKSLATSGNFTIGLMVRSTSYFRIRRVTYNSSTSLDISLAWDANHAGSSSSEVIPTKIIGLKSPLKGAPINPSETTLWTNPSPTSNFGTTSSSGTTISLSTPLTAFDQIAIYVRHSTSNSTERKFIYDYDALSHATDSDHSLAIGFAVGSSTSRVRLFYKASSSKLGFPWGTYRLQAASQTASAAYIIPTKITGIMLHST